MKNSSGSKEGAGALPCPRTDLACERTPETENAPGTSLRLYEKFGVKIEDFRVETEAGARRTGRRIGRYTTLCCRLLRDLLPEQAGQISALFAALLRDYLGAAVGRAGGRRPRILAAGLGNREITPDALGPRTAADIRATAHLPEEMLAELPGCFRVCAIHPGVTGQTGMDAADVLRALAHSFRPDVILVVDALAARSVSRLCTTIQVTDTGIAPGSGAGCRRTAIDRESMGVPVIAVGVPTVVDCATLVYDALTEAGIGQTEEQLHPVLSEGERFFVSPRDMDVILTEASALLAHAINQALGTEFA